MNKNNPTTIPSKERVLGEVEIMESEVSNYVGIKKEDILKSMDEYAKLCVKEAMEYMDDYLYEMEGACLGSDFIEKYINEKFK